MIQWNGSDYMCMVCGEPIEEDWIKCYECKQWAHEKGDFSDIHYYCDICKAKKWLS